MPVLNPGQTVVIDNASSHNSLTIRALIEQAGYTLLFLPPSSADLNKIEKFWTRHKPYLRQTMPQFDCFWDAVDNGVRALS